MRFEDTPDLFGYGCGLATSAEIRCEWCGHLYNEGAYEDKEDEVPGEDVFHTEFDGKTVCECCFERVENAVLVRMSSILPWYARILQKRRERLEKSEADLRRATGSEL